MPLDIPQAQLDIIQPIVEDLRIKVRALLAGLPFEAELALRFEADAEATR